MNKKIILFCILLSAGAFRALADAIQIDSDKPVQIVDLHQGDDDHKEGSVTLKPTPGKQFKDFHFIENGKFGDANYHLVTETPTEVTVGWSVASHRVRGPFNVVVDTKTGYLGLSVQAQLEPITLPLAPVQQNPSVPPSKVGFWGALKIIYSEINFTKVVAYLAPVFGAIWALWLGLPNSSKEQFVAWLLERLRRKNAKAKERKPRVLD